MRKIALITGSSRGIGKAIALRLCDEGFAIILHGKTPSNELKKTEREIKKRGKLERTVYFDVSIQSEVETACKTLDRVDILVNNAAVSHDVTLAKMSIKQWDDVIKTNLYGPYFVTKCLLPQMIYRKSGRIINIASIAAYGAYGKANYAAAKAGLIGLTKSLALEVAKHTITVNAVCPGFITTGLSASIPKLYQKDILSHVASGRAGTPEEVANLVNFLASDQNSYLTGTAIDINGGWQ